MARKEIVDYIIATKENGSYPRVLKILTDATEAIMNFSPGDLSRIVEENYKSIEKYDWNIKKEDAGICESDLGTVKGKIGVYVGGKIARQALKEVEEG